MPSKSHLKLAMAAAFLLCLPAQAGDGRAKGATPWIYVVKTMSTDPAKDAEFNAWYDDIDIPDVLAVEGFKRARRAKLAPVDGERRHAPAPGEGNYLALYDIETDDIDKTIIDLYVAARKMDALGRSTDLLRVAEASYYRHLAGGRLVSAPSGMAEYILIQKILCCAESKARNDFARWFQRTYALALSNEETISQAALYELYRVMEPTAMKAEELPHLLIVYELTAEEGAQAIVERIDALRASGDLPSPFLEGEDTALYQRLNETFSR